MSTIFDQYLAKPNGTPQLWANCAGVRTAWSTLTSMDTWPCSMMRIARFDTSGQFRRGMTSRNRRDQLYGSYGKRFETPTLMTGYGSVDGSPSRVESRTEAGRSDNYEAASKRAMLRCAPVFAAFYIKTVDELAVLENLMGRTVDQNIGETSAPRFGTGTTRKWAGGFSARFALQRIFER